MEVSRKYKEIFRLAKMLKDAKIPFDFYEMTPKMKNFIPEWEHYHINYPSKDNCVISVIEGTGTYGEQNDKLEIMGGLTPEEVEESGTVLGWLTAEDIFERIKKDWKKRKVENKMKVIKIIDEDTLEMKDMVIEEDEETVTVTLSEGAAEAIADLYKQALPCEPDDFAQKYKKYKEAKTEFDEIFDVFKTNLIKLHNENPDLPKSVIIGGIKATYVSPSTRTTIDSKKLKEEEPELAKKFTKTTNVSASVRIDDTFHMKS